MGELEQETPTPENFTMLQGFEWYIPPDSQHWSRLHKALPDLKLAGIDNIWIPPGCKASDPKGNGYDIYDLYDLGEFDQRGSVTNSSATKWGSYIDLLKLVTKANDLDIGIYWDTVLNHKASADHKERCQAQEVDVHNGFKPISDPYEINAWVGFDFPGRKGEFSKQKYHWYHFIATDYNADNQKIACYKILGTPDHPKLSKHFDYLMFESLDYSNSEVIADVLAWGVWLRSRLPISGMRFDAVKHFPEKFQKQFIRNLEENFDTDWFFVGELWTGNLEEMNRYLERMERKFSLFDAPLVYNFSRASTTYENSHTDLRRIFDGTLVQNRPDDAVTLVTNHDTQPHQAIPAPVTTTFKPLAYALILLRSTGYPCIFYGDLYGIDPLNTVESFPPSQDNYLPNLTLTRKLYAYGLQRDYFDEASCIGWVRYGTWDKRWGCAVIMSWSSSLKSSSYNTTWQDTNAQDTPPYSPNSEINESWERGGEKRMHVGEMHRGETWTDVLGWETEDVVIGADGCGIFRCKSNSVSVWVNKDAEGRERFGKFDSDIYKDLDRTTAINGSGFVTNGSSIA